jgi:hypothetical protein
MDEGNRESTEGPAHSEERAREERAREEIAEAIAGGYIRHVPKLPPTKEELERAHLQQDLELKKRYGNRLLRLVTVQLAIADVVFVLYFIIGVHWKLPEGVIYVWLVTTLVELVGVATVVTRYLFPRRDSVAQSE